MKGYILKESLDRENCVRKWITVTDGNWRTAVQWYRDCAELLSGLGESERNGYSAAVLGNIRRSVENYLPRAGLPKHALQEQLGVVVDYLLDPKGIQDSNEHSPVIVKTRKDALKQDLSEVIDFIFVAGFLSILLTLVLICILCCYCCRYKSLKDQERDEIEKILDSRYSCNNEKDFRESES